MVLLLLTLSPALGAICQLDASCATVCCNSSADASRSAVTPTLEALASGLRRNFHGMQRKGPTYSGTVVLRSLLHPCVPLIRIFA